MPKYVTTEEMYECGNCELECAVRELEQYEGNEDTDLILMCPRCNLSALIEIDDAAFTLLSATQRLRYTENNERDIIQ